MEDIIELFLCKKCAEHWSLQYGSLYLFDKNEPCYLCGSWTVNEPPINLYRVRISASELIIKLMNRAQYSI